MTLKAARFVHADVDAYARSSTDEFDHVDAYGVVHHLPDPGRSLAALAERLAPGGTMRLMVYNRDARQWIHVVQRLLALGRFDAARPGDVAAARLLLTRLAARLPRLQHRLDQVGRTTLRNDARFADTFLHPREARLPIDVWFERIEQAGLKVTGMFDRYGELDDLVNPLWTPPSARQLAERAADGRFENNLELYLQRHPERSEGSLFDGEILRSAQDDIRLDWTLRFKAPPAAWFAYQETAGVPLLTQRALWHGFLKAVAGKPEKLPARHLSRLSTAALQRLARLGAILPAQLPAQAKSTAHVQMCAAMDKPELPFGAEFDRDGCAAILTSVFAARGLTDDKRLVSALGRLAGFA